MGSARLSAKFDNRVIDGMVDGLATSVFKLGSWLRRAQRGRVQENLVLAFAVVAVIALLYFIF